MASLLLVLVLLRSTCAWAVLGAPSNRVATAGNAQVSLSWGAVTGATGYNIYRSTTSSSTGFSKITATPVTTTSFLETGLINGTTYWYKLSTLDATGEGALSVALTATPMAPPGVPANLATSAVSDTRIDVSWTKPTGASTIRVEKSLDGTNWSFQINSTGSVTYVTGLSPFTIYYFRVRASNVGGDSAWSNTVINRTNLPAPVLSGTAANNSATLTWNVVTGATNYTLWRKLSSQSSFSLVATLSGNSTTFYTNVGLVNGQSYDYVVKANTNLAADTSAKSNTVTLVPSLPPATPTGLAATLGDGQVSLAWNAVTGAASYTLKRAVAAAGPYSAVASNLSAPGATDTGLVNGTTYYYVVSATGAGGEGANSASVSALPAGSQAEIADVFVAPDSLFGGESATGTVLLSQPAPSGGQAVQLSSGNGAASVPSSVSVAAGQSSATFLVSTSVVSVLTSVQISASAHGITKTTALSVLPAQVRSLFTPSGTWSGGTRLSAGVTLFSQAAPGGFVVSLSSSSASAALPASVSIPSGGGSAPFSIQTSAVSVPTDVTVTASGGGVSKSSTFTLWPPTVASQWRAGGGIACAGIRPIPAGLTVLAGSVVPMGAFDASDFDERDVLLDGGTTTVTQKMTDPCSYSWSTSGGAFQDGRNFGRSVMWLVPNAPGQYTLTLTVDDGNNTNQTGQDGGARDDFGATTNDPPRVFTLLVNVLP